MKKILFVINTLGLAGAEKALLELLKRFSPEVWEVELYVLMDQGELVSQLPEHVSLLNEHYLAVSVLTREGKKQLAKTVGKHMLHHGALFRNAGYLLENVWDMTKRGRLRTDKLLWRVMSDGGQVLTKEYDIAVAFLEGGATYFVHDHVKAKQKFAFLHVDYTYAGYSRKLDRDCYPDFDRVFVVSDEVKAVFTDVYPECAGKTTVFHNLINRIEIENAAVLPGGFADDYTGKRILTVGRLTEQKAYDVAIEAMQLLKDQGIQARWYVLGEGELRKKLQLKIDSLGLTEDFVLLGTRENPYPYYKQCDLYVHATRFEGKSIAVQEAKLLGCTVLVSDCSGNREQVSDGEDGMLCVLSPEAVCEGIRKLLADPETSERYGRKAAKTALDSQNEGLKAFGLDDE